MTSKQISAQEYEEFCRYLEDTSGIVLGDNKHYLVTCRLNQLMREFGIEGFAQLLQQLMSPQNSKLHEHVIDAMTITVPPWFRDTYPFEVLKHQLLPEIAAQKAGQLRIWSAASASGQEAYSISMTIEEYLSSNPDSLSADIQIIGTDISTTMLREASEASYEPMSLARGVSEERKQRFFVPFGERWQLRPQIKSRTTFRQHNLLDSFNELGKFDIIFCRNVLIYFSSEFKSDILNRMAKSLNPGGYLFLGGAESPSSYSEAFEQIPTPRGVVYRLKGAV